MASSRSLIFHCAFIFFFFAFLFSVDVSSNEDDLLVSGFKARYPILFVGAISRLNVFFFFFSRYSL